MISARRAPRRCTSGWLCASSAALSAGSARTARPSSGPCTTASPKTLSAKAPRRRAPASEAAAAAAWRGSCSNKSSSRVSQRVSSAADAQSRSSARTAELLTRSVLQTTCSSSESVSARSAPSCCRSPRSTRLAFAALSECIRQRTSVGRSLSSASGNAPRASCASSGLSASGS